MIKFLIPIIFLPLFRSSWCWYNFLSLLFFLFFISSFFCYTPLLSMQFISNLFSFDSLSWPLIALTFWIVILRMLASQNILENKSLHKSFILTIALLTLSLLLCFRRANILIFYIFFELVLLPTLALIIIWGYQPERLQAGIYLLLYTICASLPFLITIIYLWLINGHLRFFIFVFFPSFLNETNTILSLFMLRAFLVKMPIYLTHLWLPKAHVEAPVAGSILLAGILLKLGAYGLLRINSISPLLIASVSQFILPISLWGGVITRLICLRQRDLKALIAYSSIGHIGLIIAGICRNSTWAFQAALTIRLAHGLCSSALFSLANILYQTSSTRRLFLLKGFQAIFPSITFWWFIFSIINMAAPPSINLLAEIILITSIVTISTYTVIPLGLMRFLTGAYSLILFSSTQHGSINPLRNPILLCKQDSHLLLLLHLIPLILITFIPITSTLWIF